MSILRSFLLYILLVTSLGPVDAPQQPIANVVYPVSGTLVYLDPVTNTSFDASSFLDTASGLRSSLISSTDAYWVNSLSLNPMGDRVAYGLFRRGESFRIAVQDLANGTLNLVPESASPGTLYWPFGWDANTNALLQFSSLLGSGYSFIRTDISTGISVQTYFAQTSEVSDLPGPLMSDSSFSDSSLYSLGQGDQNPLSTAWISMVASVILQATPDSDAISIELGIIHNVQTQETIFINDVTQDETFVISDWGADGRYLAVHGWDTDYLLEFSAIDGQIEVVHEIPSSRRVSNENLLIRAMLGVQDLMLITTVSDDTLLLSIAQIQDGTLYRQPFVEFARSENVNTLDFDWHLTADEAERQALSCLFDTALATRLSVGIQARVNVTSGAPLSLYAEPALESSVIAQLQDGSILDIIGDPACFSGDSYTRLWQVQLANRMTGWVVEANTTDYYLEPFIPQPDAR